MTDHNPTADREAALDDKIQDASQVAIEGFWARPTTSGDRDTDIDNYAGGLAKRIGWTGTRDDLVKALKYAADADDDGDEASRNRSKLAFRSRLRNNVNTDPVGSDPYLPHRDLSNQDAIEEMRDSLKRGRDTSLSEKDRRSARQSAVEIHDMLKARTDSSESASPTEKSFRHALATAALHNGASGAPDPDAVVDRELNNAHKCAPYTPSYVQVSPRVPRDDGKLSTNDRLANEGRMFRSLSSLEALPPQASSDEDKATYRAFAEQVAADTGFTGDIEELAAELPHYRTKLSDPDPLGEEFDIDERLSDVSADVVDEFSGGLPRTERADGSPLCEPGDPDPVHLNMAESVVRGYWESPYSKGPAAGENLGEYAEDVAPKIGYTGSLEDFERSLAEALITDEEGGDGSGHLALDIDRNLPQATADGGSGAQQASDTAFRARFADGEPLGDQVAEWGVAEPGYGKVKANRTHIFRDAGDSGWQMRRDGGGGEWTPVATLPPSAKNIRSSLAAERLGGRCIACGKAIEDSTSRGGFGPECAKKV